RERSLAQGQLGGDPRPHVGLVHPASQAAGDLRLGLRRHDHDDVAVAMGTHRDCDVVVVVSTEPETQVSRCLARGMDESDVRARIAAQLPLGERALAADVLLDNDGSLDELEDEVAVLWVTLQARAARS
ncbi:MAG TPA: dephospho-CoA kinase, partial [Actinomycetota bacterium]|nr:dephospho-CoA kinase [Actinomycetota bacterium]